MSREAYAPPTTAFNTSAPDTSTAITTQYVCGECNQKIQLKQGDAIRCRFCGFRILYKERTKRMVQFEAR